MQAAVKHGGRWIRHGDPVQYQERPRSQWQRATFRYADEDRGGPYYCVIADETKHFRFLRPCKVRRPHKTRVQRKGVTA